MSNYLNVKSDFKTYVNDSIFIDKSSLISTTNYYLNKPNDKYMCVTRPRRFGKTMALSMLNAYYSKGCNSRDIFDNLNISKDSTYINNLNKHNVIYIDMAALYANLYDKNLFVYKLKNLIYEDLVEAYPTLNINYDTSDGTFLSQAFKKIYSLTDEKFIFLIDEWDVIFREEETNAKLINEYIMFLRGLFKNGEVSPAIELVYMTGILPMKRYTTQSALNNFNDYDMVESSPIETCAGFTEDEVKKLCLLHNRNFEEIKYWYNGYILNNKSLYNPKSVVMAILKNACSDYWAKTSATEAVSSYMNYQNGALKDIIIKMITGEKISINVSKFTNDLTEINSIDSALTVLIHLGYLGFDSSSSTCFIPNYEIRQEFQNAIEELHWKEIINPISNSMKLYEETLQGNTSFINETLDYNHKELAGPFNKNKEDILGGIVQISYYSLKKYYDILKEPSTTKGRADLVFKPRDCYHIPFIIELKADESADKAIEQIKNKEYIETLGSYKGKVLLLGISYNSETLKHDSKVETIEI